MRGYRKLAWAALAVWAMAVLGDAYLNSSVSLRIKFSGTQRTLDSFSQVQSRCRIFVAGSSPVVFGLSAAALARGTGCDAVNVGLLQVSNQIDGYLAAILEYVRPGDIVVLTDRRWTDRSIEGSSCSAGSQSLACFYSALRFAPNMAANIRLMAGLGTARDRLGDVVEYPAMAARLQRINAFPQSNPSDRLNIIDKQLQAIRRHGACPLLTGGPLLIEERARDALGAHFDHFDSKVLERFGAHAWQPAALETESELFGMEGQHSSAAGRERWTQRVVTALLKYCLAPPPVAPEKRTEVGPTTAKTL